MNATGDANKAQTEEGLQYHIQLKKGDLPNIVLMPGDPKRVEKIASNWDISEKIADYRQYVTYKGEYKGAPISALSSGIGPAAGAWSRIRGAGGGNSSSAFLYASVFFRSPCTSGYGKGRSWWTFYGGVCAPSTRRETVAT